MAATTATGSCRTTAALVTFSPPKPAPFPKHLPCSYRCSSSTSSLLIAQPRISYLTPLSVSSRETGVVDEEAEERGTAPPSDDDLSLDAAASFPPLTGCKACGRDEFERGCNGEGRIQGGIATVPGFGWWPIKAYRPCPAYVASGGRYQRSGQSMDEVVSGKGGRDASDGTIEGAQSRRKKEGPKRFKR